VATRFSLLARAGRFALAATAFPDKPDEGGIRNVRKREITLHSPSILPTTLLRQPLHLRPRPHKRKAQRWRRASTASLRTGDRRPVWAWGAQTV